MRIFPRLWQQVFMYAILLVLASHLVSFVVFRFGISNNMYYQVLEDLASSGAAAVEGKDREVAEILPEFFSKHFRSLWLESPDGRVIAGEAKPGFSAAERVSFSPSEAPHPGREDVRFWNTGHPNVPVLASVPVNLRNEAAILYLYMEKMPPPPMPVLFIQGLIAVCLIGGVLSVWVTWRVTRPLRRLRSEVLEIAGGNLDARVSVAGSREISQVAEAVNSMAQNLSQNITGMRELVANISHEMRSPLARMTFSITIIEEGLHGLTRWYAKRPPKEDEEAVPVIMDHGGDPLAVRHVGRLTQEIEHMENLVNSCLLSSKLDLQQHNIQMESLNLSRLCRSTLTRYDSRWHAENLCFSHDIQDDLWLEGDESLLSLVLTNLLDNAVKYTSKGGLVRFRLYKEHGVLLLSLENSHDAIDDAALQRLFEPFFKRQNADEKTDGVGLGLALAQKIAASHQGSVTVENGSLGVLFTVRLPAVPPPSQEFMHWFFERHRDQTPD